MRTKRKQDYQRKRRRRQGRVFAWMLLLIFLASCYSYFRPLKPLEFTKSAPLSQQASSADLPWPSDAVAAIGASGYGVLATSKKEETVIPTASIAKMITAVSVLKKKPLSLGEQGPTLTLTDEDVKSYNDYYAVGGSLVKVAAGEKITEYQALEAMLLPSANNMADTLAKWAFGSLDNYSKYANEYVKQLELNHTTVGIDASGLSPTTTSTPSDLVNLGIISLQNPVIAQIVAQKSADVPVAGTIPNVNRMLGIEGVNGIKTGNSDEARGCILFSSDYTIASGKHVTIVGAVMGAPSVNRAIAESIPLLQSAKKNFTVDSVISAGKSFGTLYVPWSNSTVHAVAQHDASAVTWRHSISPLTIKDKAVTKAIQKDSIIGGIDVSGGADSDEVPLITDRDIPKPSFWWQLIRW